MLDPLFIFVAPIIDSIEAEDNLFHFIAPVEALFDSPEQFQSEYHKLAIFAQLPGKIKGM